jgi:hypothetical protein
MRTRRSQRIRRGTVEQLLHGGPVPVPDPLARLLASAAAPPQPGELAREDTAVAAFHAARLGPVAAPRREQMVTPPLARFLTTKPAALALVLATTGGIALAATMSAGPAGSRPAPGRAGEGWTATAGARPGQRAAGHLSGLGARGAAEPGPAAVSPAAVPVTRLCLALAADVHAVLEAGAGAGRPAGATPSGGAKTGQQAAGQPGPDARDLARALASPVVLHVLAHRRFPGLAATAGGAAKRGRPLRAGPGPAGHARTAAAGWPARRRARVRAGRRPGQAAPLGAGTAARSGAGQAPGRGAGHAAPARAAAAPGSRPRRWRSCRSRCWPSCPRRCWPACPPPCGPCSRPRCWPACPTACNGWPRDTQTLPSRDRYAKA